MLNKVTLIGNLGQDPEIRYTQSGSKIASFSVATTEKWKDKQTGEQKNQTQWHRVVVFNDNIANIVEQYIKKGSSVYVEGALQYRKYTGSDNIERNISEIVITQFKGEIKMLSGRNTTDNNYDSQNNEPAKSNNKSSNNPVKNIGDDLDDEIPF